MSQSLFQKSVPNDLQQSRIASVFDEVLKAHNLISSIKLKKNQQQFYICESCDKVFGKKAQWSAHQRVHTGEKPFQCELCSKRFSHKSNLKRHQRNHLYLSP